MEGIALFYYHTWLIWPFIFVFSFAYGLAEIIKGGNDSKMYLWISSISLLVILSAIIAPTFHI